VDPTAPIPVNPTIGDDDDDDNSPIATPSPVTIRPSSNTPTITPTTQVPTINSKKTKKSTKKSKKSEVNDKAKKSKKSSQRNEHGVSQTEATMPPIDPAEEDENSGSTLLLKNLRKYGYRNRDEANSDEEEEGPTMDPSAKSKKSTENGKKSKSKESAKKSKKRKSSKDDEQAEDVVFTGDSTEGEKDAGSMLLMKNLKKKGYGHGGEANGDGEEVTY